ncbi:MAG: tRNA lysidine(34) synthetase TilS [Clostridia bacterium]|nr:tRNA lysidine(34) synthetase TilS [Clostridia bacterium]
MFENKVLNTIKKYNMISEQDKIVVAVSGGPDSMALLNTLINLKVKINFNLCVAHVNHMIRKVADEETEYVKEFCHKHGIECYVKKIDVLSIANIEKISTEEAGRNVRYAFFEEIFSKVKANKIAIAHNANDNAETVLMNVIRGTGTLGLKGIEPVRKNKYIRPLIEMERQDIEQYCEDCNLNPKFDESNKENVYTRNKIRNILIPFIKREFNPNIVEGLNRLSNLATQENRYIEKIVEKNLGEIAISTNENENDNSKIILDLKKFNVLDEFIKGKIILLCVSKLFESTKGVEKKHIEDVIRLCNNNIGNKYLTPNKHLKIFVGKGRIIISRLQEKWG